MSDSMVWFTAACLLVALEMLSGTFYLLMIAIGVMVGGVAALWFDILVQIAAAAVTAAVATLLLRRSRLVRSAAVNVRFDPGVNLDIGKVLEVLDWRVIAGTAATARAAYRGALWDVELVEGGNPVAGAFVIKEMRGNRLMVDNASNS